MAIVNAVQVSPHEVLLERGRRHHRAGQLDEAEAAYREALTLNPVSTAANAALGELLLQRGIHPGAITCFERCIAVEPENVEYLNNLGFAHILNETHEFALPHLLRATELAPRSWKTLANIGRSYGALGRADKGVPWLERALEIAPGDGQVKMALANLLSQVGEFARAKTLYLELAASNATAPGALRGIALLAKQSQTDNVLPQIEQQFARPNLNDKQRVMLHMAAAKTHLDLGNADPAFDHYLRMKKLEALTFDMGEFEQNLADVKALFSQAFVASRAKEGDHASEPVFIVGMPRSGSTLLEQIVSGHSQLAGMGERPYVSTIARRLGFGQATYARTLQELPPGILGEIAKGYMSLARTACERPGRTVDKFLHNFLHVGLIRLLFPRAKILHARRIPMDCCFSMFTSPLSTSHAYTRDLGTLGRYYRAYADLMDHWAAEFPGLVLDVHYEELVDDIEANTRRVLDFLGLPFEENCLAFYENRRAVATISKWQVRQPLYRTSIERWRPYEHHLQPLIAALGDRAFPERSA